MNKDEVKDIADNLGLGMRCYIHSVSKAIKFIPDLDQFYGLDVEGFEADIEEIENKPEDFIHIEGMGSRDSFELRRTFTEMVNDYSLRERLTQALDRAKPFRNFKAIIENSVSYREKWFKFRDEKMIEWVEKKLKENGLNVLSGSPPRDPDILR